MRDYAKVLPTFWTGETGKAIRRGCPEGVIVALYLMTSPHSNMLGLYYQPLPYIAHETGLSFEGASKGLERCIEAGFCAYDEASEMVWVHEMAAFQVGSELSPKDNRCAGLQKDYDNLPNNPFLRAFFDRYRACFHLKTPRGSEGASEGLPSQEQEQEQEKEHGSGPKPRQDPIPYQAIVDAYNAALTDLPKVRDLTPKRRTLIRSAWQASSQRRSIGFWVAYFAECQDDPFLNGTGPYREPHANWRPSFDYLLRADVVTRVFEQAMDRMERTA
jgi:hypothetical protein